jgi:hypothetical protein
VLAAGDADYDGIQAALSLILALPATTRGKRVSFLSLPTAKVRKGFAKVFERFAAAVLDALLHQGPVARALVTPFFFV